MEKIAENEWNVKAIALITYLLFFTPFWKVEKVAENGRKVKGIALLFCCFLPLYEKWKKSLKMDEK